MSDREVDVFVAGSVDLGSEGSRDAQEERLVQELFVE